MCCQHPSETFSVQLRRAPKVPVTKNRSEGTQNDQLRYSVITKTQVLGNLTAATHKNLLTLSYFEFFWPLHLQLDTSKTAQEKEESLNFVHFGATGKLSSARAKTQHGQKKKKKTDPSVTNPIFGLVSCAETSL